MSVTARRDPVVDGVEGMRPALLFGEAIAAIIGVKEHPDWQAAMRRRGIADFDHVQIDPWPAGVVRLRRARTAGASRRCISFLRDDADRQRLRPPDRRPHRALRHRAQRGARGRSTTASSPMPPNAAQLPAPTTISRACATDLKPIEITQPEGPSFTVDGNLVQLAEVVVPHRLRSVRGARAAPGRATTTTAALRPILHRASITRDGRALRRPRPAARLEERVRRGRVGPRADDAARSRSAATASARSTTSTRCSRPSRASRGSIENAICMHEEDYGILWKHVDL